MKFSRYCIFTEVVVLQHSYAHAFILPLTKSKAFLLRHSQMLTPVINNVYQNFIVVN